MRCSSRRPGENQSARRAKRINQGGYLFSGGYEIDEWDRAAGEAKEVRLGGEEKEGFPRRVERFPLLHEPQSAATSSFGIY